METSLILIKPDGVQRRLMGRILARFEEKGLQVVGAKLMRITNDLAERHYAPHKGKPFYPGLVSFMTSGPVLALALRGKNSVAVVRKMLGATFGSKAEPGTIRGDFGISDGFNLVHASDSPETAKFELSLFFRPEEVLEYPMADTVWVYDTSSDLR
jgi:nucleoside-diphosphate kinase